MSRRNILIVIGGVVVVVVIALVVAFSGGTPGSGSPDTEAGTPRDFAPVEVTGQDLPVLAGSGSELAQGMPAPTLSGTSVTGEPLTIEPGGGEPMVLIFLAHWCPHCQAEVPRLQDWIDETGGPEGVKLFGVATGTDPNSPNYPPVDWLEREGFTPPVLLDDQARTAASAYGLSAYPFWVVLDGEGNVVARFSGELGRDGIEQLFQEMQQVG